MPDAQEADQAGRGYRATRIAGRITPLGWSRPDDGSQWRFTAKTRMSIRPTHGAARDWPSSATRRASASGSLWWLSAAAMPSGTAVDDRQHERRGDQEQRRGQALQHQRQGWGALSEGVAEVTVRGAREKGDVLGGQGLVEAEVVAQSLELGGRSVERDQDAERVAAQPGQAEDEQRDAQEDAQPMEESLGEEAHPGNWLTRRY